MKIRLGCWIAWTFTTALRYSSADKPTIPEKDLHNAHVVNQTEVRKSINQLDQQPIRLTEDHKLLLANAQELNYVEKTTSGLQDRGKDGLDDPGFVGQSHFSVQTPSENLIQAARAVAKGVNITAYENLKFSSCRAVKGKRRKDKTIRREKSQKRGKAGPKAAGSGSAKDYTRRKLSTSNRTTFNVGGYGLVPFSVRHPRGCPFESMDPVAGVPLEGVTGLRRGEGSSVLEDEASEAEFPGDHVFLYHNKSYVNPLKDHFRNIPFLSKYFQFRRKREEKKIGVDATVSSTTTIDSTHLEVTQCQNETTSPQTSSEYTYSSESTTSEANPTTTFLEGNSSIYSVKKSKNATDDDMESQPCHPFGCGPLNPQPVIALPCDTRNSQNYEDALTGMLADRLVNSILTKVSRTPGLEKHLGLYRKTNVTEISRRLSHPPQKVCPEITGDCLKKAVLREISEAIDKLVSVKGVDTNCLKLPHEMVQFLRWLLTDNPTMPMPQVSADDLYSPRNKKFILSHSRDSDGCPVDDIAESGFSPSDDYFNWGEDLEEEDEEEEVPASEEGPAKESPRWAGGDGGLFEAGFRGDHDSWRPSGSGRTRSRASVWK